MREKKKIPAFILYKYYKPVSPFSIVLKHTPAAAAARESAAASDFRLESRRLPAQLLSAF